GHRVGGGGRAGTRAVGEEVVGDRSRWREASDAGHRRGVVGARSGPLGPVPRGAGGGVIHGRPGRGRGLGHAEGLALACRGGVVGVARVARIEGVVAGAEGAGRARVRHRTGDEVHRVGGGGRAGTRAVGEEVVGDRARRRDATGGGHRGGVVGG